MLRHVRKFVFEQRKFVFDLLAAVQFLCSELTPKERIAAAILTTFIGVFFFCLGGLLVFSIPSSRALTWKDLVLDWGVASGSLFVGLSLIGLAVYVAWGQRRFRQLTLRVSAPRARLGDTVQVAVELVPGQSFTAERVAIRLVSHEGTVEGTKGTSDDRRWYSHEQVHLEKVLEQQQSLVAGVPYSYQAALTIPANGMHTFDQGGCHFSWEVELEITNPGGPDVRRWAPVTVVPEALEASGGQG